MFHSVVHRNKRFNVQFALALKELKHKYLDVLAVLTSLVRNIIVKVLFLFIHYVQTLIMHTQKLTQLMVSLA